MDQEFAFAAAAERPSNGDPLEDQLTQELHEREVDDRFAVLEPVRMERRPRDSEATQDKIEARQKELKSLVSPAREAAKHCDSDAEKLGTKAVAAPWQKAQLMLEEAWTHASNQLNTELTLEQQKKSTQWKLTHSSQAY